MCRSSPATSCGLVLWKSILLPPEAARRGKMVSTRDLPEALAEVDLGGIDVLKALKEESDTLRTRLKGLEDVKADFDPAVFSRVNADYARQLATIENKAEPLRQQARESYARLRGALNDISNAHEAVKLDRQE